MKHHSQQGFTSVAALFLASLLMSLGGIGTVFGTQFQPPENVREELAALFESQDDRDDLFSDPAATPSGTPTGSTGGSGATGITGITAASGATGATGIAPSRAPRRIELEDEDEQFEDEDEYEDKYEDEDENEKDEDEKDDDADDDIIRATGATPVRRDEIGE